MTSSPTENSREKHWLPLESNPDLMNKYIHNLGVSPSWQFYDVFGTDESLLSMIPTPVLAVLLLYPITTNSEQHREEEEERREQQSHQHQSQLNSLFYMKQTVGNACGTIGVFHAVLNNRPPLSWSEEKFIGRFYRDCQGKTPEERAAVLENADEIEEEHQSLATEASSDINHPSNDNLHFIALIHHQGLLVELDGRKGGPIIHGTTTAETLLKDAVKVVSEFMGRDADDIRFNMTALAPAGFD